MSAFPYAYKSGFEAGAVDTGGTETDTGSLGSYVHYTECFDKYGFLPWRGAYCWLVDQSAGGTTECIQTVAGFDVAANKTWAVGFAFYAKSTTMSDGDRTIIAGALATGTYEVTLQLYYTTAAGLQLLLTEANDTAVGSNPVVNLDENKWHWIEMYGINDPGANDGTAYLVLDGVAVGSISSLNQGAFTDFVMGLTGLDAGHNAGYYAFDDLICIVGADTTAVRTGYRSRYSWNVHVDAISTTSYGEHLFVGPGTIDNVSLLTANAGDMIRFYDTDRAYTTGTYGLVAEANFSSGMPTLPGPIEFQRGCYCVITAAGANGARALINIATAPPEGYAKALYYGNEANLKKYVTQRVEILGSR